MALFRGYDQPGRGIPKAPIEKKGIFKFFEIYGRRCWTLMGLNLLYLLFCLPIITIGPATAAMTKVTRNYSQERHAFVWADFIETFKKCFKQSFIMGIIDIVAVAGFLIALPTYRIWSEQNRLIMIPLIITVSCMIVFFMMHFYIYQMIVSTNLSLHQILKNSFFLVSLGLKSSLYTLLVAIVIFFIILGFFPWTLFILPFWPFSFMNFVMSFNCYPVIRKYVIQPYYDAKGKENPEFDYLNDDSNEAVFEDSPELENNEEKPKSKKRGKTIS